MKREEGATLVTWCDHCRNLHRGRDKSFAALYAGCSSRWPFVRSKWKQIFPVDILAITFNGIGDPQAKRTLIPPLYVSALPLL